MSALLALREAVQATRVADERAVRVRWEARWLILPGPGTLTREMIAEPRTWLEITLKSFDGFGTSELTVWTRRSEINGGFALGSRTVLAVQAAVARPSSPTAILGAGMFQKPVSGASVSGVDQAVDPLARVADLMLEVFVFRPASQTTVSRPSGATAILG